MVSGNHINRLPIRRPSGACKARSPNTSKTFAIQAEARTPILAAVIGGGR